MGLETVEVRAIDAVVRIWTAEALSHRPDWKDGFFQGKVNAKSPMSALSLEQTLERMAEAGIERGFLVAARTGSRRRPTTRGATRTTPSAASSSCAASTSASRGTTR